MPSPNTQTLSPTTRASHMAGVTLLLTISAISATPTLARDAGILPAAAQERTSVGAPGSRRTLQGVIQTYWIDYPDHARRVDHLVTPEGTVELRYTRQQRRPLSGATVSVTGRLGGNYLALDPSDVESVATSAAQSATEPLPDVFGAQKLLVIPVKFSADPSEPWTLDEMSQRVFGEADAYFRDVSLDRTWFEGDITPWVTVDHDPTVCDPLAVAADAEAEAARLGYDPAAFDRFLYMVPALDCGWAGVAGVGTSQAWFTTMSFSVVVHELGHNFGLPHSHSAVCLSGESWSWPDGCTNYEYGDIFDVMGASSGAPFNALHQRRLGYLDSDPTRATTLVEVSGDYRIGAYAANDSLSRALRIPAGVDAASGAARTIYVTRREPVGRDVVLGYELALDQNRIQNGVTIHIGLEGSGDGALLDMTPLTRNGISDVQDAPLLVGEAYVDPVSGVTVAPVAVEPGVATIAVTLGSPEEPIPGPTENHPPQAVDDTAEIESGKSGEVPVLLNDFDPDGDALVITYLGVPEFGSVSLNGDGVPVYRAPRKFQGTDSFRYAISDGDASADALVTITVKAGTRTKGKGGRKK